MTLEEFWRTQTEMWWTERQSKRGTRPRKRCTGEGCVLMLGMFRSEVHSETEGYVVFLAAAFIQGIYFHLPGSLCLSSWTPLTAQLIRSVTLRGSVMAVLGPVQDCLMFSVFGLNRTSVIFLVSLWCVCSHLQFTLRVYQVSYLCSQPPKAEIRLIHLLFIMSGCFLSKTTDLWTENWPEAGYLERLSHVFLSLDASQRGSLFTLFLYSPLLAFSSICGLNSIGQGLWEQAQEFLRKVFRDIGQMITRSRTIGTDLLHICY